MLIKRQMERTSKGTHPITKTYIWCGMQQQPYKASGLVQLRTSLNNFLIPPRAARRAGICERVPAHTGTVCRSNAVLDLDARKAGTTRLVRRSKDPGRELLLLQNSVRNDCAEH